MQQVGKPAPNKIHPLYTGFSNAWHWKSCRTNPRLISKPKMPGKEALSNPVSPGERNPIEGKFGQAKVGYGLANIGAKLKTTSQSWIATNVLVLNLVRLTRLNSLYLCQRLELIEGMPYPMYPAPVPRH